MRDAFGRCLPTRDRHDIPLIQQMPWPKRSRDVQESGSSPRPNTSPAFTLLEVVIGMMLMAGLATALLYALTTQRESVELAKHRHAACDLTDDLLNRWHELPAGPPPRDQGFLDIQQRYSWRTEPIGSRTLLNVPVTVIRFQVFLIRREQNANRKPLLLEVDLTRRMRISGQTASSRPRGA